LLTFKKNGALSNNAQYLTQHALERYFSMQNFYYIINFFEEKSIDNPYVFTTAKARTLPILNLLFLI